MSVENLRSFGEITLLHEVDHSLHGFAFIDRVGNHAFEARAQANGLLRLLRRNPIDGISIVLDQDDIVITPITAVQDTLAGANAPLSQITIEAKSRGAMSAAADEVSSGLEAAEASPAPDPATILDGVYATNLT